LRVLGKLPGAFGARRNAERGLRRRRGRIARWAGAAALICIPAAAASAADELRIIRGGVYPPFTYLDASGAMVGFDVDIADALCTVLAVHCVIADVSFEQMIPALLAERGDAIIASLSITEDGTYQKINAKYFSF